MVRGLTYNISDTDNHIEKKNKMLQIKKPTIQT